MEELDSIRASLQSELAQSDIDIGRVLELSSQIANADPNHVRFSVDASHVTKLGLELVGKQETAVAELVKNGYDADATRVDLFFENVEREGGTLTISDDGHGMTRDQLVNGFMRISTRDKVDNPRSPQYGRQRAGSAFSSSGESGRSSVRFRTLAVRMTFCRDLETWPPSVARPSQVAALARDQSKVRKAGNLPCQA